MISAARSPPIMLRATDTSATMSMLAPLGLVRSAVTAYGLTNRSWPSARRVRMEFARVTCLHLRANLHRPGAYSEVLAHLLDEQRHLVGDQASIRARARQHGQAAALASRGHEEEGRFKLDDRLERVAAAEMLAESPGQALKAGRDGGQVLGIFAAQIGGRSDRQTIPGQNYGFVDLGDSRDEVIKQPVQVAARVHSASPSSGGSPGRCGVGLVRKSLSVGSVIERPRC